MLAVADFATLLAVFALLVVESPFAVGVTPAPSNASSVSTASNDTLKKIQQPLKCLFCATQDYIPAWAERRLLKVAGFNETYAHSNLDVTFLARGCDADSPDAFCQNGTFCAKRTVSYHLTDENSAIVYNSYVKLCTSSRLDGSGGIPTNGECRTEEMYSSPASPNLSVNATWCYCNDGDVCNAGKGSRNALTLASYAITMLFGLARMGVSLKNI